MDGMKNITAAPRSVIMTMAAWDVNRPDNSVLFKDKTLSLKNSAVTFCAGSAAKKEHNIMKACGELLQRLSVPAGGVQELIDMNKLSGPEKFSSRITQGTRHHSPAELYHQIKNELKSLPANTELSPENGHEDKKVNLMLAALYELITESGHAGNADPYAQLPLKSDILNNLVLEKFSLCGAPEGENVNVYEFPENILKSIYEKHQSALSALKEKAGNKISYQQARADQLEHNLREFNFL